MPDWLPPLCTLATSGGDWAAYVEVVYEGYRSDFHQDDLYFRGRRVKDKWHPPIQGKSATFWHIISEGTDEFDRTPDLRRCERIRWPRAIIENAADASVLVWNNLRRGNETRVLLWLEAEDYLVVLAERRHAFLLWTAYCTDHAHTRRKLRREHDAFKRSQHS